MCTSTCFSASGGASKADDEEEEEDEEVGGAGEGEPCGKGSHPSSSSCVAELRLWLLVVLLEVCRLSLVGFFFLASVDGVDEVEVDRV